MSPFVAQSANLEQRPFLRLPCHVHGTAVSAPERENNRLLHTPSSCLFSQLNRCLSKLEPILLGLYRTFINFNISPAGARRR